jgi:hypothetical protein
VKREQAERGEWMPASVPGLRWLPLGFVAVGAIVLLLLVFDFMPWLRGQLHELPLGEALTLLRHIFFGVAATLVFIGTLIIRSAWRVWRSGQAPAPGSFLLVETRIVRGDAARRRAAFLASLALLIFAAAVGAMMFPNRIEQAVLPQNAVPLPAAPATAA